MSASNHFFGKEHLRLCGQHAGVRECAGSSVKCDMLKAICLSNTQEMVRSWEENSYGVSIDPPRSNAHKHVPPAGHKLSCSTSNHLMHPWITIRHIEKYDMT